MKSQKAVTKQEKIENCGKNYFWTVASDATKIERREYCGYIYECSICFSIEMDKRAKVVAGYLEDANDLYRCVVEEADWTRVRKQFNLNGINSYRVPQNEESLLIVSDGKVDLDGVSFVQVEKSVAIRELTTQQNLFTPRRRSTTGYWRTTDRLNQNEETVLIKVLEPRLLNKTGGRLDPFRVLYKLAKKANSWGRGRVTKENAQEFITWGTSVFIEMALAIGYTYDMDNSRIIEKNVPVSAIKKWKVQNVTGTKREYFGEDDEGNPLTEKTFYDERLLAVVDGVAEIKDRLAELEAYRTESINHTREERLVEDAVSLYKKADEGVFLVFYPQEVLEMVKLFVGTQCSKEELVSVLTANLGQDGAS